MLALFIPALHLFHETALSAPQSITAVITGRKPGYVSVTEKSFSLSLSQSHGLCSPQNTPL